MNIFCFQPIKWCPQMGPAHAVLHFFVPQIIKFNIYKASVTCKGSEVKSLSPPLFSYNGCQNFRVRIENVSHHVTAFDQ